MGFYLVFKQSSDIPASFPVGYILFEIKPFLDPGPGWFPISLPRAFFTFAGKGTAWRENELRLNDARALHPCGDPKE